MSAPATHPFTCNTCQVAFRSSDLQRTHMQSDWHRYNLKRRVASLPPLSSDIFAEKVLANKASAAATAARTSYERACDACGKNYYSENAYTNHLGSHRHRAMMSRPHKAAKLQDEDANSVMSSTFLGGDPSDTTSLASTIGDDTEEDLQEVASGIQSANLADDDDSISRKPTRSLRSSHDTGPARPLGPKDSVEKPAASGQITKEEAVRQCLFCTDQADDLNENLQHMQRVHGMFVPEKQYLVDLEGLILHLCKKVHIEYQCLYCNRLKWSEDGIKTHMRDLSHCKIAYDTEEHQLEIGEFYDFRSTYSDDEESEDEDEDLEDAAQGGGVKLGAKRSTKMQVDGEDDSDASEDGGWETDDTASSAPSDEIGALYNDLSKDAIRARLQRSKSDSKRHRSADGFHSHAHNASNAAYADDYELHLPTGRVAGHRSLNKYYRQNLRTYPTPAEREEQRVITEAGEDTSDDEGAPRNGDRGRQRDANRQALSRSDGALGLIGVTDQQKKQLATVEKKQKVRQQRAEAKGQWRRDVKGNSQKHYRDPLLQ